MNFPYNVLTNSARRDLFDINEEEDIIEALCNADEIVTNSEEMADLISGLFPDVDVTLEKNEKRKADSAKI